MPRPMLRLFCKQIEKEGGPEVIFNRIREGHTIREIAATYDVHHSMLYRWKKKIGVEDEWDRAMEESADDHVDKAHELAKKDPNEAELPGETRSRLERADFFLKLAKIRNKRKYGNQQQAGPTVNIANLHLDALQAAGHVSPEKQLEAPIQEAEILPPEGDEAPEDEDWDNALSELM